MLHHDLLNHLEEELRNQSLISDLTRDLDDLESSAENIRHAIGTRPYLIAEVWTVIKDYQRILAILDKFNDLSDFIAKSSLEAAKETEEFKNLQAQIVKIWGQAPNFGWKNIGKL